MGLVRLPRGMGGVPLEDEEAAVLYEWLEDVHGLKWCHVPNERKGRPRPGTKRGVPDILIFDPPPRAPSARGVAIELKREKGGDVSPEQVQWGLDLMACGWVFFVAEGADEAIEQLTLLGYDRPAAYFRAAREAGAREAGSEMGEHHPAVKSVLQFFEYEHLPEKLKTVSKPFCGLAQNMADTLPQNAELTVGLRKLLEAKDCAVRAALAKAQEPQGSLG